jgi:hypothetical protein
MGVALRIGVLGVANIARQFAAAVAESERVWIDAVASRPLATAEGFARDRGIPRAYGFHESLLADPQIDAVYMPLPNTLHADWAIRALDAGKHVLCEKPLATTSADGRAMFAAARRNGRHVVEASPYRAQPQTLKLRELIAEGAIETTYLNHPPFIGPPILTLRRGIEPTIPRETIEVRGDCDFLAEAESIADMISEGSARWSGASPEESIDIALTLGALAESARPGAPITLSTERRPS